MPEFIFLLLYMLGHSNKLIVSVVVDYKKLQIIYVLIGFHGRILTNLSHKPLR